MKKFRIIFVSILIVCISAGGVLMISSKDQILSNFYVKRGSASEDKQSYDKAVAYFQKAIQYNPKQTKARLGLGRVYSAQNKFDLAEQAYKEGIEKSPDNVDFYIGLSSIYVKQNKFYEASELLDNIRSSYVRTKIGALRPKPPELSPTPGRYEKRIQIDIKNSEENTSYYTMGDSKEVQAFTGELSLDNGLTSITAFTVSKDGLVSDITRGDYTLDKIVERVNFTDPAMEAMAREALNKPAGTFMTDELWEVKSLSNLSKSGQTLANTIGSLNDLKYFTNLEEFSLYHIKSSIPFDTMPQITTLNTLTVSDCSLTNDDLLNKPVFQFVRELDLSKNKINSLHGITSLKNLEKLNINGNNISDLSVLSSFSNLYYLDAGQNAISDISPLTNMNSLKWLSIKDNRIEDLSSLITLTNLEYLDLSKNNFSGLEQVSKLIALKGLTCSSNEVDNLTPLAQLKNLEVIDLSNNRITNIATLSSLNLLKSVNLSGNYISDLSPLKNDSQISELILSRNMLKDISSIKSLPNLVLIDVQNNPIQDYSPLVDSKQLQTVFSDQSNLNKNNAALSSESVEGIPENDD